MTPHTEDLSPPQSKRAERRTRRRVLMLTHRVPYPPDRGDRIRAFHLLRLLNESFDIDLACTSDAPVTEEHQRVLGELAPRLAITPVSPRGGVLRGIGALACGQPITPSWHYRRTLAATIRRWHRQVPFDAVLCICTGMARYAGILAPPERAIEQRRTAASVLWPRLVLDLVDVDSLKWRSYSEQSPAPLRWIYGLEARRLSGVEAGRGVSWDAVSVISDAEAEACRRHVGDHRRLVVIGNGVDLDSFTALPDPDTNTLVFTGVLNYRPNVEGIRWFVAHVMPLLQRLDRFRKDLRLRIVGRDPCAAVHALGDAPGVEVVGPVADIRDAIGASSVAIAPLQTARGVQNKVLEAMACARSVVVSSAAAEGIDAVPGRHLLVADQPQQWASHIERLLRDAEYRRSVADAARQLVARTYAWPQRARPMVDLLHTLTDRDDEAPASTGRREAA